MKRNSLIILLVLILLWSFSFYGCSSDAVVTVNGETITEDELNRYMEVLKATDAYGTLDLNEEQFRAAQSNMLDSLIILKVLDQYAAENNIEASSEEIEIQYQMTASSYVSELEFEQDLSYRNISKDMLREEIRSRIVREKIFDKVTADVEVTEEKARQYYEENKETMFSEPEKVEVSHILIQFNLEEGEAGPNEQARQEAMDKIIEVQSKLKEGEPFEEVAKQYSDDPSSAEKGGDLGYIKPGDTVTEFEEAAFGMEIGKKSDIVETMYGFHILKVTDRQEQHIKEYEDAIADAMPYLRNREREEFWKEFVFDLLDDAQIIFHTDIQGTMVTQETYG